MDTKDQNPKTPGPVDPVLSGLMHRAPRKGIGAFFEGLLLPVHGFRVMRRFPQLWRYGWLPILINTFITFGVLGSVSLLSAQLYSLIEPLIPEGWIGDLIVGAGVIGLGLLLLVVGIGLALVLSLILCSYFYGKLAHTTEILLGANPKELKELSIFVEGRDAISALVELCAVNVIFLLFHIIPGIGSFLAAGCSWYYSSFILGMEFLEYSLALRGMVRSQRRAFARSHRLHTLGLGTVAMGLQLVPILGAFVLTTGVVGGVLLQRRAKAFP